MGTFKRLLLLAAWGIALVTGTVASSSAATLTLTTNQTGYTPGSPLTLSATLAPTNDAGVLADLYIAVVLPDGSIKILDNQFAWGDAPVAILPGTPIGNLQAPDFYALALPAGLPSGQYTFVFVAVAAGADPFDNQSWLGVAMTTIDFQDNATTGVTLVTVNASCVVNQACNAALVASVSGGLSPYYFAQDSFAYGTRPLNTNIDLQTGNIVGTPSQAGTYTFNICAVDLGGNQDCQPVSVTVGQASVPGGDLRVYLGGDVSTLTTLTLDGVVIKDTGSQNLDTYKYLSSGTHTLTVRCTEVYCFAYLQLEAPTGYTISPTSIRLTPDAIPPGTEQTVTLTLFRQ